MDRIKGLSIDKLAEKSGVKRLSIIQIEHDRVDLRLSTLVKLLNELLPTYPNGKKDFRCLHLIFNQYK